MLIRVPFHVHLLKKDARYSTCQAYIAIADLYNAVNMDHRRLLSSAIMRHCERVDQFTHNDSCVYVEAGRLRSLFDEGFGSDCLGTHGGDAASAAKYLIERIEEHLPDGWVLHHDTCPPAWLDDLKQCIQSERVSRAAMAEYRASDEFRHKVKATFHAAIQDRLLKAKRKLKRMADENICEYERKRRAEMDAIVVPAFNCDDFIKKVALE